MTSDDAPHNGQSVAPARLEVINLVKSFPMKRLGLWGGARRVQAVQSASFSIGAGETLALVGKSGCGKTTTGHLILRLLEPTSGEIQFEGRSLSRMSKLDQHAYRRAVQAVFQDPFSSLSPRVRVRDIVSEPIKVHKRLSRDEIDRDVSSLLQLVGLPNEAAGWFPHQFSGGQRQRIAIARALALSPKLIVLDEPVSALDVSIRAQILNLLRDLQQQLQISFLLISHDLAAVAHMAHRVAVMYLGRIVEIGPADQVTLSPRHPYTQGLFAAELPAHPRYRAHRRPILTGEVPSPINLPSGCSFHPRCPRALEICKSSYPSAREEAGHLVTCHLLDGAPEKN